MFEFAKSSTTQPNYFDTLDQSSLKINTGRTPVSCLCRPSRMLLIISFSKQCQVLILAAENILRSMKYVLFVDLKILSCMKESLTFTPDNNEKWAGCSRTSKQINR